MVTKGEIACNGASLLLEQGNLSIVFLKSYKKGCWSWRQNTQIWPVKGSRLFFLIEITDISFRSSGWIGTSAMVPGPRLLSAGSDEPDVL